MGHHISSSYIKISLLAVLLYFQDKFYDKTMNNFLQSDAKKICWPMHHFTTPRPFISPLTLYEHAFHKFPLDYGISWDFTGYMPI